MRRGGLRHERLGEQGRADCNNCGRLVELEVDHDAAPSMRATAARVAAALDRWTLAPAATRAAAVESRPCGSPTEPTSETTTARSRPSAAARSRACAIADAS